MRVEEPAPFHGGPAERFPEADRAIIRKTIPARIAFVRALVPPGQPIHFPVESNLKSTVRRVDRDLRLLEVKRLEELKPCDVNLGNPGELSDILSNALKFRREGVVPRIEVSARLYQNQGAEAERGVPAGEACEITIADNGIGFEMQYLDRIFNIFQRLHGRNEYPGTGIGLATCRKIVERHNGLITAVSEPGQGTRFLVRLPVRQARREQSA